jgi:hypothetical protein
VCDIVGLYSVDNIRSPRKPIPKTTFIICIWVEAGDTGMFKDFCGFEINDKNAVAINIVFDRLYRVTSTNDVRTDHPVL